RRGGRLGRRVATITAPASVTVTVSIPAATPEQAPQEHEPEQDEEQREDRKESESPAPSPWARIPHDHRRRRPGPRSDQPSACGEAVGDTDVVAVDAGHREQDDDEQSNQPTVPCFPHDVLPGITLWGPVSQPIVNEL